MKAYQLNKNLYYRDTCLLLLFHMKVQNDICSRFNLQPNLLCARSANLRARSTLNRLPTDSVKKMLNELKAQIKQQRIQSKQYKQRLPRGVQDQQLALQQIADERPTIMQEDNILTEFRNPNRKLTEKLVSHVQQLLGELFDMQIHNRELNA